MNKGFKGMMLLSFSVLVICDYCVFTSVMIVISQITFAHSLEEKKKEQLKVKYIIPFFLPTSMYQEDFNPQI